MAVSSSPLKLPGEDLIRGWCLSQIFLHRCGAFLAFFHRGAGEGRPPEAVPPEIWSENNRNLHNNRFYPSEKILGRKPAV